MLIIGLTGSIGMGKSAAADHFRSHGIAVCDADAEVHKLYAGPAAPLIEAAFPGTTGPVGVDRARLAVALLKDPAGFKRLEAIVHPLVREAERAFLAAEKEHGAAMAVLEIPLLLETGGERNVDAVVVVSAPPDVQRERVLRRPGMTAEKLTQILSRQMPDAEKRKCAHFVVDTGGTLEETYAQIDVVIEALKAHTASAYDRAWI
jgi:dephospho-CoA kinase